MQHANDALIMGVSTLDIGVATHKYCLRATNLLLLHKLYRTRVWMPRDGESDEDGCRKDQCTKTHRRDGSASKIDHLWSPSQHNCNRLQHTSSCSCDFCGALHLENEVGGVRKSYINAVLLQKLPRMSDRQSEESESHPILLIGLVCLDIINHCDR